MRLRADFESYGDVKDIYDMIQTRGMMFITYVSQSRAPLLDAEMLYSTTCVRRTERE